MRPLPLSVPLILLICTCLMYSCKKSTNSSGNSNNTPPPNPPVPKSYQLVWADEFDSTGPPDPRHWAYDTGGTGWGNHELEYYTNARPENARVENGNLVIEARKEFYVNMNYTSARLVTKKKAQWTYGRFEIRAKIPSGTGTWPAIWLLSATDPLVWPDDGELDIMEEVGFNPNVIYGTAHNKLYNGALGTQKGGNVTIPTAQTDFHVYGLEWETDHITWSVDSVDYFTYVPPSYGFDTWPYSSDFFMILNIAIGGSWGGQKGVDDSIFPQQMLIDYIRVYQRK